MFLAPESDSKNRRYKAVTVAVIRDSRLFFIKTELDKESTSFITFADKDDPFALSSGSTNQL